MPPKRDQRSSSVNNASPMNNNNKITKRRQTAIFGEDVDCRPSEQRLENAKLCELVKAAPCIYDNNHINYGNKEAVEAAWKMIAERCGHPELFCKKRFRNLRLAYGISINAYKTDKGANIVKPYYLHKQLDFLKPFLTSTRGRKGANPQRETIIEILTDDSNDSMPVLENQTRLEEDPSPIEIEEHNNEVDKYSEVGSETPTEANTSGLKRRASLLSENLIAKRSLISSSPTPEDTTELESNNDAKDNIIILEDKKFLNCILYVMQDMNKRQKHIFKANIWKNVHIVMDSDADYSTNQNNNMSTDTDRTYDSKHHSDTQTFMQQMKLGIARLNESELREMKRLMRQREREIELRDDVMVQIPVNSGNYLICDNNVTNTSERSPTFLGAPCNSKQEPTSTEQDMIN